ncbi:MAG: YqgE/AlgH family protein [Mucilaginibacter sp.]
MLSTITAAAGRILISEPFMLDPNFKRSVVLLTEYADTGAVGFILNHPGEYLLGDVLPDTAYSEIPVYTGGPVGENTLHFIHKCPDKIDDGIEICDGIFWGGNFETVKQLISTYQLDNSEIKFFTGYSGWEIGQLEEELRENAWIVSDKFTAENIFSSNEQTIWREAIINMGQRYAHIANFPENPELN